MNNDPPLNKTGVVPASQGKEQDAAYAKGVATGYSNCLSVFVLAILGFVTGCWLAYTAHANDWINTKQEYIKRHGDLQYYDFESLANAVTGAFVGAVTLPAVSAALYAWLRSRGKWRAAKNSTSS
jgi:hypothetical protein